MSRKKNNNKITYMTKKQWKRLVLQSLADGTMWKHRSQGPQESLTKSTRNGSYVTYIATPTTDDENLLRIERF